MSWHFFGGEKTRTAAYPAWPVHDERDVDAVAEVVRSGNWGGFPYPGPQTRRFLDAFIELHRGQFAVAVMKRYAYDGSGAASGGDRLGR